MIGIAIGLAGLAAVCNAGGDLLQRASTRSESSDPRHGLTLFGDLLRQKKWLAGVVVSLLGLCVHVGALSLGELAQVQPVLVGELPLAVLGSALFFRRRLSRRDWLAVAALAVGLALFVSFLAPEAGSPLAVPGTVWAVGLAVVAVVVAVLAVAGWRAERDLRGGLLSAAAGVGYGLTGVLFSVLGRTLSSEGVTATLASWQTYAALAVAAGSFYLLQNALAAGKLVAVEPGLTLANPIVAVTWGLLVFGETAQTGLPLLGSGVGAALLIAGVVLLARSPVLQNHERSAGAEDSDQPAASGSSRSG